MIRSIILINTNISTDSYNPLNIPHSNITAICFQSASSTCLMFNIYNNCNNNSTILLLGTYLHNNINTMLPSLADHMLWFGNFN